MSTHHIVSLLYDNCVRDSVKRMVRVQSAVAPTMQAVQQDCTGQLARSIRPRNPVAPVYSYNRRPGGEDLARRPGLAHSWAGCRLTWEPPPDTSVCAHAGCTRVGALALAGHAVTAGHTGCTYRMRNVSELRGCVRLSLRMTATSP